MTPLVAVLVVKPTKTFIASTSPESFPIEFSGTSVDSMAITSLPGDHVVLCYVEDGVLYYRESYTRGSLWKDPATLVSGLHDPGNLTIESLPISGGMHLLAVWDALEQVGNESTRKAFYLLYDPGEGQVTTNATRLSSTGDSIIEYHPSFTGGEGAGFTFSWLTNQTGYVSIAVRHGATLGALGAVNVIDGGTSDLYQPVLSKDSTGHVSIAYNLKNATFNGIMIQNITAGVPDATRCILIELPSTSCIVSNLDCSFTSAGDVVLSLEGCSPTNASISNQSTLIQFSSSGETSSNTSLIISNTTSLALLQHHIFQNDQIITIWLENRAGKDVILFSITDFDMDNRNSIMHSILLAYVFIALGIFNLFVSLKMMEKRETRRIY